MTTKLFLKINPEIVGNGHMIIGTLEKKTWRENMHKAKPFAEIQAHTSDFKSYQEIRMTMGGWFHKDQEPPVVEPPKLKEWVKS